MPPQTKIKQEQLEKITISNVNSAIADSAIPANKLVANVTDSELGCLTGLEASIISLLAEKLAKNKLIKDGFVDWNDDTIAATALAIKQKIQTEVTTAQIGGSMIFKGAWSTAIIDNNVKAGYTYVYDSGTPPTGHTLEAGDMLIANVNNPNTTTAANWLAVQTNISGAVTSIETSTADGQLAVFSGTNGKAIKKSSLTGLVKLNNGVPSVAGGNDLPSHDHNITINLNEGSLEVQTGDAFIITGMNAASTHLFNDKMVINVPYVSVFNGAAQAGKYVSGIGIQDNIISVVLATLPIAKTQITPTGALNGTNKVFTIPESIVAGTEEVIINGQTITRGVDYTISASTITLATDTYIPVSDDIIRVNYVKS